MSKIEFHPEALEELKFAARYYELQQVGLSGRFIEAVETAISSIVEAPHRWPILDQDIRRRLTRVFPYAILYAVEPQYILVVAVMHCHREPGYWRNRVGA